MRLANWLMPALLLLGSGCATVPQNEAGWSEAVLQARKDLRAGDYALAIPQLQGIKTQAAHGRFAEQARLDLIYAYHKSGDHHAAVQEAADFIERYPEHPKVAYAYYMRGLAIHQSAQSGRGGAAGLDTARAREAFEHYAELVRLFPSSPYTEEAVQRMVELRDALARKELSLAEQRFAEKDFRQAASRARYVAEQYAGSAAVPDALVLLVRAYRSLGMNEAADTAFRMLDTNHPDHPAVEVLREGVGKVSR